MINKYFNETEGKYHRIEMDMTEPDLAQIIIKADGIADSKTPEEIADCFVEKHESVIEEYLETCKEGMRQKTRMVSLGYLMFHEAGVDMEIYRKSLSYYKQMENPIDHNFSNLIHHGVRDTIKSVRLRPFNYNVVSGTFDIPDFKTYITLQQAYWDFR